MENTADRMAEGIIQAFALNPYDGETIALDIGSYFEPEKINEGLTDLKDALQALNEEGTAYYTIGTIEIVMETD